MKPTLNEALVELGIDYSDETIEKVMSEKLDAAYALTLGAVGEDIETYLPDDARIKQLTYMYLNDLCDERGTAAKAVAAQRRIKESIMMQLQLDLANAKGTADAKTV